MSLLGRVLNSNFVIRLRSWEYWPFGILQLPLFLYFAYLAFRARSIGFFSASNPGIVMGGMFGESKYDVMKKIPDRYIPKTILIHHPAKVQDVVENLRNAGLKTPLIFKPDLGERGFMVKRVNNEADIASYLKQSKINFLVQEFVNLPLEFGIFYTRLPNEANGRVTSVTMKEMLYVVGDGTSTLQQLIFTKPRAKLQWQKLQDRYQAQLTQVVEAGKRVELVSIGNHALGTTFFDGQHLINQRLHETFDNIAKQIDGFYFGRFDLRCSKVDDLYTGNVTIMELNGCGAEPTHIYQPGYSLFKAVGVMFTHWRNIFRIAMQNRERGAQFISFREAYVHYKKFKAATS